MKIPPRKGIYRDDSLEIRPLEVEEAGLLCDAVQESLAEIGLWENWCTADYDLARARAHIELSRTHWLEGRSFNFNVFERASGLVVASVSLNTVDSLNLRANLGYWTRTRFARQGIALTAAHAVAQFGFDALDLVRLEIVAQEPNRASRALAERLGGHLECIARKRLMYRGETRDAAVYRLLREELVRLGASTTTARGVLARAAAVLRP